MLATAEKGNPIPPKKSTHLRKFGFMLMLE
jgi:hypothetical protein